MIRSLAVVALLPAALLSGCASPPDSPAEPSIERAATDEPLDEPLVERVRRDIRLEPLLTDSRVTVTERDGVIVFGGTVESLQDLNIVRDIVDELDETNEVENDVVVLGGEGA